MKHTVKSYIEFAHKCGYNVALVKIEPYGIGNKICVNPYITQDTRINHNAPVKVGTGQGEILEGEYTGYKLLLHTTGLEGLRMAGFEFNEKAVA